MPHHTEPIESSWAGLRDAWADLVHGGRCVVCGRPGRPLCAACTEALPRTGAQVAPDPSPAGLARCYAAGPYADPLRAVLLAHKERGVWALARPLGDVLAGVLQAIGPRGPLVLVPVPSRAATVRRRGHDPLTRMVRAAAARLRADDVPALVVSALWLRWAVADQAGLTSADRSANLAEAMAVTGLGRSLLARIPAVTTAGGVVVCDDVLTTGATAREAQRALEEAGVPVRGIACVAATRRRARVDGPAGAPAPLPVSPWAH